MTPLLIGCGAAGIRAMKHQLIAASEPLVAIAVGDEASVATLGALQGRHTLHSVRLQVPA